VVSERTHNRAQVKYAFFMYSSKVLVEQILRVHQRVPNTLQGTLRMEHTESCPSISSLGYFLEHGKPLDRRYLVLSSKAQTDSTLWEVYASLHARSAAQRISRAAFAKFLEPTRMNY
jgi:hypothetical protein